MQLTNILDVKATLRCLSGLHIGAGDTEMHIGGIDNTVVRNPITQRPYIPGSSLKGKVRSLLEWRSGFVQENPLGWADYERTKSDEVLAILRLFGAGGGDQLTLEQARLVGPSRVSFWDVAINDKWISEVEEDNLLPTEAKSENSINRISGTAPNPRYTERVVAGAAFDFRVTVKVLDSDGEELLRTLLSGLKLLELDSLGGSGSRGYGKVRLESLTINGQDRQKEFDAIQPFGRG